MRWIFLKRPSCKERFFSGQVVDQSLLPWINFLQVGRRHSFLLSLFRSSARMLLLAGWRSRSSNHEKTFQSKPAMQSSSGLVGISRMIHLLLKKQGNECVYNIHSVRTTYTHWAQRFTTYFSKIRSNCFRIDCYTADLLNKNLTADRHI